MKTLVEIIHTNFLIQLFDWFNGKTGGDHAFTLFFLIQPFYWLDEKTSGDHSH